ncbi:hypothetical protein A6A05_04205 [Magnetospirillum moscoviense]|uniref:Uncharacterized protein n=1 Tax=Magnetospirillum moscoviense TaxID=1437059 RepID=A0A178M9X6_9PROT|nr:hypothetical protein A6A05_04205 [Magnetospirillum moscoviense]
MGKSRHGLHGFLVFSVVTLDALKEPAFIKNLIDRTYHSDIFGAAAIMYHDDMFVSEVTMGGFSRHCGNEAAGIEPRSPARATETIRKYARSERFDISYKLHAKERMEQRGLFASDVL